MPTAPTPPVPSLSDPFQRRVTYVRFSITDRCNFRCVYCMPERTEFVPRAQVLTLEELARLGRAFTELGVTKIRLTGGEPLLRNNVLWLCRQLSALPGLRELVLTTNGSQLREFARPLREAGVKRLNLSLDTLRPQRFARLTRRDRLQDVLEGLEAARNAGFDRIKLNAVVLRDYNHDETVELAQFALERGLDISFIEEMPLGEVDSHDRGQAFYGNHAILEDLRQHYTLLPSTDNTGGPSRYYRVYRHGQELPARVGFISPHSHNFCADCNRVRVTAEGRLLLCLGQENSVDLRRLLRAHPGDSEPLKRALVDAMRHKPVGHDFNSAAPVTILRHMNHTGG